MVVWYTNLPYIYAVSHLSVVPEKQFREALDGQGLELVWFVDHYSSKNPLNDKIKSNNHPMKTRKYFIYMEGDQIKAEKFWDARFANVRDSVDENEED